ncbi:MAG: rRNA maturation RNase YbeY [bacterium]|nr:rRNA maturation RNase YbeY [bacterium]MDZ4295843.1 rRNA maturation RNase YbeY [Patescibacteria group bacterium]MDZ4295870.1 rRNA maturation RNase YbeY [Patescibacteria group bacterium]
MLTITNLTTTPVDRASLERVFRLTLRRIARKGELSVVFVGDSRMRNLNARYRGKDKTTDVLAFPQGIRENAFMVAPEAQTFLGEVVIAVPVAKRQARRAGHSFAKELATLFVHGILHVCGYDHERSDEDERIMMGLQEEIISNIKKQRSKIFDF